MNPCPAVISSPNAPTDPTVKNAPPSPAIAPPMRTLRNLVRLTSMPAVSAAFGCSPTARTRRPQRVRNSATCSTTTAAYMR